MFLYIFCAVVFFSHSPIEYNQFLSKSFLPTDGYEAVTAIPGQIGPRRNDNVHSSVSDTA